MKKIFKSIVTTCFIVSCTSAFSNAYAKADEIIRELYHTLNSNPTPMATRLNQASYAFINIPYEGNPLGEGEGAAYDQGPLYRIDKFDCETYVDTVVAIALAPDFEHFPKCIQNIRYENGKVDFISRNHFASLDWNRNNQRIGVFKDITQEFKDENGKPVAMMAKALINKPKWYSKLPIERIRLPHASEKTQKQKLQALRNEGKRLKAETARIPYIPLTALFDAEGRPNQALFAQIPDGAVIEIIRPNWNLSARIGSRLNVSHMGFVFRKNGELRFRHASIVHQKVSDVSLVKYLKNARTSPTIRGINVQVVLPNTPARKNCELPSE